MTDFLLPAPVDNDACDQLPGMALPTPRGNHKVFYPIFPPDKNAPTVLNWLQANSL
jgi:hypothetical protein